MRQTSALAITQKKMNEWQYCNLLPSLWQGAQRHRSWVLAELSKIRLLDVVLPTSSGAESRTWAISQNIINFVKTGKFCGISYQVYCCAGQPMYGTSCIIRLIGWADCRNDRIFAFCRFSESILLHQLFDRYRRGEGFPEVHCRSFAKDGECHRECVSVLSRT